MIIISFINMKKVSILIILIFVFVFGSACTKKESKVVKNKFEQKNQIAEENKKNLIGGDRSDHNCLVSAGYSWCDLKSKCLRFWEEPCLSDVEISAVQEYINKNISELSSKKEVLGGKFYVTNIRFNSPGSITVDYEDGHIALRAQAEYEYSNSMIVITSFIVEGDKSAGDKNNLALELVKQLGNEIFNLDEMEEAKQMVVKWNTEGDEIAYTGYGISYGGEEGSREVFEMYLNLLDEMKKQGFKTDEYNTVSDKKEISISRIKKDLIVCNVIKSETKTSSNLELRCADWPEMDNIK